jgi:hypothetical protein
MFQLIVCAGVVLWQPGSGCGYLCPISLDVHGIGMAPSTGTLRFHMYYTLSYYFEFHMYVGR